jgi:hypothetical protein
MELAKSYLLLERERLRKRERELEGVRKRA